MRDALKFWRLFFRVKHKCAILSLSFPRRVECNICGWMGRRFLSDDWHPRVICPQCYSQVRHRLLAQALKTLPDVEMARLIQTRRVLHFAPEPTVSSFLSCEAAQYVTADLNDPRADLRLDLRAMPSVPDGSFDAVLCCDVLEHVTDDRGALREIFRVLAPGGYAILTVPQKDGLEKTFEDPRLTSPEERLRAYGQEDHLRIYGEDFVARLDSAGFGVRVVDANGFPADQVRRFVLSPPSLSPHPLATNFRRVFFARKPGC